MKKILIGIIILIVILALTYFIFQIYDYGEKAEETSAINEVELNMSEEWKEERSIKNVYMEIKDVDKSGATIVITDKNEKPYTYAAWFRIDKKVNDSWIELEKIDKNFTFSDIGIISDQNGQIKQREEWKYVYGDLPEGEYRLVKDVYDGKYEYFWAEFTI